MITNEMILDAAKECGDWNGQTCEMNDVGLQAFAKRMYQLGLLDKHGIPRSEGDAPTLTLKGRMLRFLVRMTSPSNAK